MEGFLWDLIPWGYQVLLVVEGMRNAYLNLIFPFITDFGSELGLIVIISLVYWCVSKPIGQGVAFAYLYTSVLNAWIKHYFGIPRPDDPAIEIALEKANISERITPLRHETSPSFLSLHAQGAVVVWGYLAYHIPKTWFRILAGVLIVLIGFSRLYLGVHFPQDVIGGFILGLIYLVLWILAEPKVRIWLAKQVLLLRYAIVILAPIVIWLIYPVQDTATPMGAAIGLGVGYILEGQTIRFSVSGTIWKRILRGMVGLIIVLAIYFGLGMVFGLFGESMGETMAYVWRLIRYALLGFAGAWLLPWIFVLVGLAQSELRISEN